ncbi:MAG: helix-turn-helix transcriptional regulator [Lachnospiraceae bacterium]|jgi:transcriptional regulator with XRE-family HTH domain|nr:helix-turn-helix transcriptional regulator [Lachnospiraceae bacterium]
MIFADKLIQLRKKAGWSQEELAEQMNVTRQSVSKWEAAQSVPDLEKILHLSELFSVSTDYLLKDELEEAECNTLSEETYALRRVSMEEANAFLSIKAITSKSVALATFLCIISPICLFLLAAASEVPGSSLPENVAAGIGMVILLTLVTIAVAIFISSGRKTEEFEYLEKETFETEYGVSGMVTERKAQYNSTYTRNNIFGTSLCIMSIIPLFAGAAFNDKNEMLLITMLSVSFVLVGIGVVFFVSSGIIWASYQKLLQEGDYSKAKKEHQPIATAISAAYWLIITAIYLGYSLSTNNWGYSWIIWVVAGVVFPAIVMITNLFWKKR